MVKLLAGWGFSNDVILLTLLSGAPFRAMPCLLAAHPRPFSPPHPMDAFLSIRDTFLAFLDRNVSSARPTYTAPEPAQHSRALTPIAPRPGTRI